MYVIYDLLGLVVLIAVIYLLIVHFRQKKRLAALERQVELLWRGEASAPGAEAAPEQTVPPTDEVAEADETGETDETGRPAVAAQALDNPWVVKGPVEDLPVAPVAPAQAGETPKRFVFNGENLGNIGRWLAENWFLAVAALSLALAGVFLVQYGVENGLLTPFWRVMGAAFLGVALIAGGEFVRRRWGDWRTDHTAYLPSTFSGAGLIALFAAVLSARQLYGLIGAEAALVYLVMVSVVAVVLGWFYGPFLAVVGILGATAAPFVVGGESESAWLFYYYFALVAIAALAVDAIKRWAWVSALALILTFGASWVIWSGGAGDEHFIGFGLIAMVAAVILPRLSLWPSHDGAMVLSGIASLAFKRRENVQWSAFPTRVAAGAFAGAGAAAFLVASKDAGQGELWLALFALAFIFVAATVWCRRAPALDNLAIIPAGLFLAVLVVQALDHGVLFQVFRAGMERSPEAAPPATVSVLAGFGLVGSMLAFWRTLWGGARAQAWAAGAALLAPLVLVTLEVWWFPRDVLGAGRWAGHAIIIAAIMVLFAERVARRDGEDRRRTAYFALAAVTMISFALVVVLSQAALTAALAVMVFGAALTDRRLNLPLLGIFVQIGVIVIGWRLILFPGIDWALGAPIWELGLAYVSSSALLWAAWEALGARGRVRSRVVVESGIWAILGVLASLLLERWLGGDLESHWGVSLLASVWLMLMFVQLYRLRSGGVLRWVRIVLAVVYGLVALLGYAVLATFMNPLLNSGERVVGPPVFDSLLVAYGVPALVLAVGVWKARALHRVLRYGFMALAALFAASYVALEIRRFWQGRQLDAPGTVGGELYSYTIAMILVSVAVLLLAFSRRSTVLRQIATVGIGLTIAKVFLIDMAGLTGLLRVASFLGLGLSLAALGWLYRRMAAQWERGAD